MMIIKNFNEFITPINGGVILKRLELCGPVLSSAATKPS